MARKILSQSFLNQPAVKVAQGLLGKFLVRKIGKKEIAVMITETEAYDGFRDKASHAHRGKTARNFPMFGSAGYWYVYFTYGMHWMLNIVTRPKDYPAAVLIRKAVLQPCLFNDRCIDKVFGTMVLDGPGKLTKCLKIDKKFNNKLAHRRIGLWIEDRGVKISASRIKKGPRIGVAYAGPIWSKKHYRFYLE